MSRLGRYGILSLTAFFSLLGSVTAWAVPADALRCTFEVRDESGAVLSSTEVSPQVARVPLAEPRERGYRETGARFSLKSTTSDGAQFGATLSYTHATDGYQAFQTSCVTQSFCPPSNSVPGGPIRACIAMECAAASDPRDDQPYAGWRPVALFDGVPQLDGTGLGDSQRTWTDGSATYRTSMDCRHVGTYP
jgi:hypothetical protein